MSNKIINTMKKLEKIIDNTHEKLTLDQYEYVSKYSIIQGQVVHINSCLDHVISSIYIYKSARN